jgi:hypothetical protein
MPEHADEDLLGHVLAVRGRDAEQAQQSQNPAFVTQQQGLESLRVAAASRADERAVGDLALSATTVHTDPPRDASR